MDEKELEVAENEVTETPEAGEVVTAVEETKPEE